MMFSLKPMVGSSMVQSRSGVSADEWRDSLSTNRNVLGLPGPRSLIEADVWGSTLTGASITTLGYTVDYESGSVAESFVVFRPAMNQPKEIVSHEISIDQAETTPGTQ